MPDERRDPQAAQTVFFDSHPAWLPPVATVAELPTEGDELFEGMRCYVDDEDVAYRFDGVKWNKPDA